MAPRSTSQQSTARRQRTIYLPEAIDRKVRLRAAQLDTTVSAVIGQALQSFFAAERAAKKKARPGT